MEKMIQGHYTERDFIKIEKGKKSGFDYQTAIYVRNVEQPTVIEGQLACE